MPMFQRNEQSDLPTPKRAQEIVNIARERLASSGGKASQLPAMIERVKNEFAVKDDQNYASDRGGDKYQQPNTIDNYIDKVLEMSGMTGSGNGLPSSGPIPEDRPMQDETSSAGGGVGSDYAADAASQEQVAGADDEDYSGWSPAQLLAGAAGVGGLVWLLRKGLAMYNSGQEAGDIAQNGVRQLAAPRSSVDETIDAIDGVNTADKQARIEGENRPLLEGPRTAITDQSDDAIDEVFRSRVEGASGDRPSTQSRFANKPASTDFIQPLAQQIIDQGMSPRDAVRFLQENGVDVQDFLPTLAERSNTVKNAAKNAAKAMAR